MATGQLDAPAEHPDHVRILSGGASALAKGAGGGPGAPPAPITLEELDRLHLAASPAPWHACRDGECKCKGLWAVGHPVAQIKHGEWGDEYPALRLTDVSAAMSGTKTMVEAYTERILYGSIDEDLAKANILLMERTRNALPALLTLVRAVIPVAFMLRAGRHRLAMAVDEASTDEEKDQILLFLAAAEAAPK